MPRKPLDVVSLRDIINIQKKRAHVLHTQLSFILLLGEAVPMPAACPALFLDGA